MHITSRLTAPGAAVPREWILVVPTKLTFWEQKFMGRLAGDSGVQVSYRDRTWLDTQLGLNPSLSNYFRHYSDNDYLQEKAEQFRHNPLVRDAADIAERVRILMASVADADPDWSWDVSTQDGMIVQTLRAKHANAALLSPVELSFSSLIRAGSEEAKELQQADAFGYVKPISIPGDLVKDFMVTGAPLVAQEGQDDIAELQLLPAEPGEWVDADLTLTDNTGEVLGHLPGPRPRRRPWPRRVHLRGRPRFPVQHDVPRALSNGADRRRPLQLRRGYGCRHPRPV